MLEERAVALRASEIGFDWEQNKAVEWSDAEELVTLIRTLPNETLDKCPRLTAILALADSNQDWDIGQVCSWPAEVAQALEDFSNEEMEIKLEQWIVEALAEPSVGPLEPTFLRQVLEAFRADTTKFLPKLGKTAIRSEVKQLGHLPDWRNFFKQTYDLAQPVHILAQAHQRAMKLGDLPGTQTTQAQAGYRLPAPDSYLFSLIDPEALDVIWKGERETFDFASLTPPVETGVVSQYVYANRQGQLVLAVVFRDGSKNVLWDFGRLVGRTAAY